MLRIQHKLEKISPLTTQGPAAACGHGRKKCRLVTVEEYPWKFVSPQLLDGKGQEILYPVEESTKTTGIGGGRGSWREQSIIIATWRSAIWTGHKPSLWML
jgi:hypothetical protein